MDSKDPFLPFLNSFFNFTYNSFLEQEEGCRDLEPKGSPLNFYDRHIDSKLICKRVEDFSHMTITLAKICDDYINKFHGEGHKFLLDDYHFVDINAPTYLKDAESVYRHYNRHIGYRASIYATKLHFDPDGSRWDPVLCMDVARDDPDEENPFVHERYLCVYPDITYYTIFDSLTDVMVQRILELGKRFPGMAICTYYPMTPAGKSVTKQVKSRRQFSWESSRTIGIQNSSAKEVPLDSNYGILHRGRILARHIKKKNAQQSQMKNINKSPPSSLIQKKSAYLKVVRKRSGLSRRIDFQQYIQRAWAIAVEKDATFFIFNCGIYERLGVRHRASQTLYVSPLIEPINCRNPPYGKLHIGLQVAAIEDVLQRYENGGDGDSRSYKAVGDKRPAEDDLEGAHPSSSKRLKVMDSPRSASAVKNIAEALSERELALITLFYGVYCSPVPAAFLRVGSSCATSQYKAFKPTTKSQYSSTGYLELVLDQPTDEGAVGMIHPAKLSLTLESGETLRHNFIVKLAFSERQRKKLRNEYDIYSRLSEFGSIPGIGLVHGLFEDQDSDTLALFMEDAGQSLFKLQTASGIEKFVVSQKQRDIGVHALDVIHKARIVHNDIRPANILIDAEGQLTIIDFDAAYYMDADGMRIGIDNRPSGALERNINEFAREHQRLEAVFDGTYTDDWDEIY